MDQSQANGFMLGASMRPRLIASENSTTTAFPCGLNPASMRPRLIASENFSFAFDKDELLSLQ